MTKDVEGQNKAEELKPEMIGTVGQAKSALENWETRNTRQAKEIVKLIGILENERRAHYAFYKKVADLGLKLEHDTYNPGRPTASESETRRRYLMNLIMATKAALISSGTGSAERLLIPGANKSRLVDDDWYLAHNLDVKDASHTAVDHYIAWGYSEMRIPNRHFAEEGDPAQALHIISTFLENIIDLGESSQFIPDAEAWINAIIVHSNLIDKVWYIEAHSLPAGADAIKHYTGFGIRRKLPPNRYFCRR